MPLVEIPDDSFDEETLPEDAQVRDEDDLLTQDEVDSIVQKRLNRQERNLKSDLKESDEFWEEMAQARGVELREDGKPKGSLKDEEIQELRRKASRVDELESQLDEYESEIESTRETKLETDVLTSADGIQDGAQEDVVSAAKRRMTYDDEYGWVKVDEDGEIVWDGGDPVGPGTVVDELREEKPYFFRESSMSSGPESTPTSDASGDVLTESQYEEKRDQAIEEGDDETLEELERKMAEGEVVSQ